MQIDLNIDNIINICKTISNYLRAHRLLWCHLPVQGIHSTEPDSRYKAIVKLKAKADCNDLRAFRAPFQCFPLKPPTLKCRQCDQVHAFEKNYAHCSNYNDCL